MSDEFLITDERINTIAKTFNITKESVELLHKDFRKLEAQIKEQHLAHLSRVLESYFKEKTGNPEFVIEYVPYEFRTPQMRGSMSIYRWWFKKFTILYDDTLSQKEIRVNISHELGHLYLLANYYTSGYGSVEAKIKFEQTTEPMSSIFGLFVVSNKNHFYQNLDFTGHKHDNWESILKDFKNL